MVQWEGLHNPTAAGGVGGGGIGEVWACIQSLVGELIPQMPCSKAKKKKKKSNNNKTKKSQQKKLTSSLLVSQFYLIMDILINFYSCKTDHAIHLLKIL